MNEEIKKDINKTNNKHLKKYFTVNLTYETAKLKNLYTFN